MSVTRDIHSDIADIMQDAACADGSQRSFSTKGWTQEQLNCLNGLLQYAWNRGYKLGYQEGFDQSDEAPVETPDPVVGPYLDEPDSPTHPIWKRLRSIANWLTVLSPNAYMEAAEVLLTASARLQKNGDVPAEATIYQPGLYEKAPYFECTPEQWERHTHGMTTSGQNVLANMLAHHCLLARRDDLGWILTRFDLITSGKPWWHVSNDGVLTYDYDPQTKARTKREPIANAPTPEELNRIKDFLLHVQKCLHRNKEYAPVVTWELQAMIAILNDDRETLARMDKAISLVDGPRPPRS